MDGILVLTKPGHRHLPVVMDWSKMLTSVYQRTLSRMLVELISLVYQLTVTSDVGGGTFNQFRALKRPEVRDR